MTEPAKSTAPVRASPMILDLARSTCLPSLRRYAYHCGFVGRRTFRSVPAFPRLADRPANSRAFSIPTLPVCQTSTGYPTQTTSSIQAETAGLTVHPGRSAAQCTNDASIASGATLPKRFGERFAVTILRRARPQPNGRCRPDESGLKLVYPSGRTAFRSAAPLRVTLQWGVTSSCVTRLLTVKRPD